MGLLKNPEFLSLCSARSLWGRLATAEEIATVVFIASQGVMRRPGSLFKVQQLERVSPEHLFHCPHI